MEVYVRGQGIENFLRQVWQEWCRRYPGKAQAYREILKHTAQNLLVPSGRSRGGQFYFKGHIPRDLFFAIEARHPGFFSDPMNYLYFKRICMGDLDPLRHRPKGWYYIEKNQKEEKEAAHDKHLSDRKERKAES